MSPLTPDAKQSLLAARARRNEERQALMYRLAEQYQFAPESSGFQAAWDYAWEQGHSAGLGEVEIYFHDVMRVVKAFLEERGREVMP